MRVCCVYLKLVILVFIDNLTKTLPIKFWEKMPRLWCQRCKFNSEKSLGPLHTKGLILNSLDQCNLNVFVLYYSKMKTFNTFYKSITNTNVIVQPFFLCKFNGFDAFYLTCLRWTCPKADTCLRRTGSVHGVHNVRIVRNWQDFCKYCKMSGETSGFWDFSPKCQGLSGYSTLYSNFPGNIHS